MPEGNYLDPFQSRPGSSFLEEEKGGRERKAGEDGGQLS
jgi:hypothetical protein